VVGEWEEAEDDYYGKNAISRLDEERKKEMEELDKECRPKTIEEGLEE
jgi:hypothetical protein